MFEKWEAKMMKSEAYSERDDAQFHCPNCGTATNEQFQRYLNAMRFIDVAREAYNSVMGYAN